MTKTMTLAVVPAFLVNETQANNTASANNTATSTVNSSATGDVSGYVCSGPRYSMFIQYTNIGGQLTGTFYKDYEDSNSKFDTYNSPITGEISGNNLTSNVKDSGQNYSGNLSGGMLNLAFPQSDGTVQNYQFSRGP